MLCLLNASAGVEAVDDIGFTPNFHASKLLLLEPFRILGETDCVLSRFYNPYNSISVVK